VYQHCNILYDCVEGEPKDWLMTQPPPRTVDDLERMLLAQFGHTGGTQRVAAAKLKALRYTPGSNKSVRDICWVLEANYNEAHPYGGDMLKIETFKECLPDYLVNHIETAQVTTYEDAKRIAQAFEGRNFGVTASPSLPTARINATATEPMDTSAEGGQTVHAKTVSAIQSLLDKHLHGVEEQLKSTSHQPTQGQRHNNRAHPYNNGGQRGAGPSSAGQGAWGSSHTSKRGTYFDLKLRCDNCGGFGHTTCSYKSHRGSRCFNCNGHGHIGHFCPSPPRPNHVRLPELPHPGTDANAVPLNAGARGGLGQ
jgi:hypothetical protein